MYIPPLFAETDIQRLHHLMHTFNFAILFSSDETGPVATHLPFMLDTERGEHGTLIAHFARANPHWKSLQPDGEVLVVFQGVHTYISPTWYDTPSVIPTWNYTAVHAYGKPCLIHDTARLKEMVTALADYHEGAAEIPNFEYGLIDSRLKSIVGLEIPIDRLEGKFKLNQNKTIEDQHKVITKLEQSELGDQHTMAQLMRENLNR